MEMKVSVDGIAQIGSAMARLKSNLPAIVQNITLLASGLTVDSARPTIPRESGDAARSLRHYLTNTGAAAEGGSSVDYYRWLELGGASGRNLANKRPVVEDGRYIYPGYLRVEKRIQAMMEEEITKAVDNAGLEGS